MLMGLNCVGVVVGVVVGYVLKKLVFELGGLDVFIVFDDVDVLVVVVVVVKVCFYNVG